MAPKKKKKVNNPDRGFATTSIPAKTKIVESSKEDEVVNGALKNPTIDVGSRNPEPACSTFANGAVSETLHTMGPEELETHLEESALQILLERHGEKSKKDASRQINKLKTEQRVLRSQSEHLKASSWLTDDMIQRILDLILFQETNQSVEGECVVMQVGTKVSEEELMIRLWTLEQALEQLGFLRDRIQSALLLLLQNWQSTRMLSVSTKDSIWGLEEAFDFLARVCAPEEMPDYDLLYSTDQTKRSKRINRLGKPMPTNIATSTRKPNTVHEAEITDSETESAGEIEPDHLMTKYLSLQSQIYHIQPECSVIQNRTPKHKKATTTDPRAARIMAKIGKIESDILFDRDEAYIRWMEMRCVLVQETAERRKFQLDEKALQESNVVNLSSSIHADGPENAEAEDPLEMMGNLFSSLPETSISSETGATELLCNTKDGHTVAVRDFGRWAGLNPRRVFEEACRARDSSCIITYSIISESPFAFRHSVLIEWSRSQDLPATFVDPIMGCEVTDEYAEIQMISISTPNPQQSEAYVSTFAMNFLFSSSPKEEKVYLRLPAIWRELWAEISEGKKQQINKADRNVLREIRSMITGTEHIEDAYGSNSVSSFNTATRRNDDINHMPQTIRENLISLSSDDLKQIWSLKVSTQSYRAMLASRMALPIWNFKDKLLRAVAEHQVVIVCGETGCGKSTQIPVFILENELSNGRDCKIYTTEPRRISAISLARRVSEELGERKGDIGTSNSLVGYAIRLESQVAAQTKLIYATTGIVMRMLEQSDNLQGITTLVLDEVHERSIDSDFLLIVLRKLMNHRKDLKVILMSATVNALKFSSYLSQAPILYVPGRTFPVKTKYLEDVVEAIDLDYQQTPDRSYHSEESEDNEEVVMDSSEKKTSIEALDAYSVKTQKTLAKVNEYRIGYDLILRLLETIATKKMYSSYSKAILVFLPGIAEIRRLGDMILGHPIFSQGWQIYPLHSTIPTDEQERAFIVPPQGSRKIVLATNIAETGITIPDVTCVVDIGKHKEMRFDERRQLSRLVESFISRANAKQRRGRAGRVQKGLCFHLFTKARHDKLMLEEQIPEMLRLSLQDLVLRVKTCKLGGIEQTLSEALDPPTAKNIQRAIDSLIDVKALTSTEELTPLGEKLSKLPLDVFLGKLILLGAIYQCLDATLSMAAILSSKSPFSAPLGARPQADLARLAFKRGDSDLLTVYNAYCAWRRVCMNEGSELVFCRKNFLSQQTMSNIEDLKMQLTTSLIDAGFLRLNDGEKTSLNKARFYSYKRHFFTIPDRYNVNTANDRIMDSVIAWSFYPKLLVQDGKGWKNVTNNQSVSLHATSVNKGAGHPMKWLSFYHIMQSSNRFYNAHETTAVEDLAIALGCGNAEFKMYSGVIVIDGNRVRLRVDDWKTMLAIKTLRTRMRQIMAQSIRRPGRALLPEQQAWMDIFRNIFSPEPA